MFGLFIDVLFRLLWLIWSVSAIWESGLKEKYDGYGEDWIFMPDGKGQPQVAVIKAADPEGRSLPNETIEFILYTRSNLDEGLHLYINDSNVLRKSYFSTSKPTKFITHGWKSNAFSENVINLKEEYLKHGDYNILLVNWEPMAASTFYLGPMRNTYKVGRATAEFIDFLARDTGLATEAVHFIGHSLGAHVAGNAGELVRSGKLGRVTGLDPALPGFHLLARDSGRLDSSDAQFVDIVHSCGGVLGYMQPLGHVDFYPNAGVAVQPGCCCVPELIEACSHGRSYKYFTESINSIIGFRAKRCENWDKYVQGECDNSQTTFLGEHVDKSASGSYFLKTKSEPPYAYNNEIDDNNV